MRAGRSGPPEKAGAAAVGGGKSGNDESGGGGGKSGNNENDGGGGGGARTNGRGDGGAKNLNGLLGQKRRRHPGGKGNGPILGLKLACDPRGDLGDGSPMEGQKGNQGKLRSLSAKGFRVLVMALGRPGQRGEPRHGESTKLSPAIESSTTNGFQSGDRRAAPSPCPNQILTRATRRVKSSISGDRIFFPSPSSNFEPSHPNTFLSLFSRGGLELLCDSVKIHEVNVDPQAEEHKLTMKHLLSWVRHNLIKERPEMFMKGDTVRPGVLVLVNDCDWELSGQLDTVLEEKDTVVFISTLHGG
ncbi:ubiquitin related modifier 1 [Striga asiatica]|uniref:Ubiquitin-related modifier 1 homolog n=1 Tax=Striga asiatica TaxID=4170 RepID=A0A5A7QS15_STRAF|nr:ubiquitin related modifier 1 [Striga asiatica]